VTFDNRPISDIGRAARSDVRLRPLVGIEVRGNGAWVSITSDILAQLPLSEIAAVVFYKRDEITTDLICCDVEVAGRVRTFHEEEAGWKNLIAHLAGLPGFRTDWYAEVVNPPFATSETVAYPSR